MLNEESRLVEEKQSDFYVAYDPSENDLSKKCSSLYEAGAIPEMPVTAQRRTADKFCNLLANKKIRQSTPLHHGGGAQDASTSKEDNTEGANPTNSRTTAPSTTPPRTAPPSPPLGASPKPAKVAPIGPVLGRPMEDVIAGCLSEEEIMGLKEMFKGMDTDNSGTITLEELKQGLAKQGTKLSEYEAKQLMEAADADGNGIIDYDEFITATMHMNRMDREEHLYTAFQHFDKDNSGYITTEELEQALRDFGMHDGRDIKEIISEVDADNDGRINYDEFVAMMRKGNPEANPKKRRDDEGKLPGEMWQFIDATEYTLFGRE
ncbi:hypothetical protein D5086_002470 [Populus alba]|uniref:Uncharacterized protein n=1 Tax=Populus alba TaxID=43335 RepID=A0ACC4D1T7_POPAL